MSASQSLHKREEGSQKVIFTRGHSNSDTEGDGQITPSGGLIGGHE